MLKVKKDDLLEIHFMDHAEDYDNVMSCIVYGRVTKTTPKSITVMSWDCINHDAGSHDHNNKVFTIVKRAITGVHKLERSNGNN